jgi:hypothetical protein
MICRPHYSCNALRLRLRAGLRQQGIDFFPHVIAAINDRSSTSDRDTATLEPLQIISRVGADKAFCPKWTRLSASKGVILEAVVVMQSRRSRGICSAAVAVYSRRVSLQARMSERVSTYF